MCIFVSVLACLASTSLAMRKRTRIWQSENGATSTAPLKSFGKHLVAFNTPIVDRSIAVHNSREFHRKAGLRIQALMSKKRSPLAGTREMDPVADEILGFDASFTSTFLARYWQKKPLMIRQGVPNIDSKAMPVATDLLELSLHDDVVSRIVTKSASSDNLILENGPFDGSILDEIPAKDWSIIVQEVDRHVPAVADLWDRNFSFVPMWRREDVMVSYSRQGGGVGAHVDSNDVFLIQGKGTRQWSIENAFISNAEEQQRDVGEAMQRLHGFQRDQSWDLHPGDMLYLPARIPHEGIALDDQCMTFSMGFRTPSKQHMAAAYCNHICQGIDPRVHVSDISLDAEAAAKTPGGVQMDAAALVHNDLHELLGSSILGGGDDEGASSAHFDSWLGEYLTAPLRPRRSGPMPFFLGDFDLSDHFPEEGEHDEDGEPLPLQLPISVSHGRFSVASTRTFLDAQDVLTEVLQGSCSLRLLEGVRAAYTKHHVCFDGQCLPLPSDLKEYAFVGPLLCDSRSITPERMRAATGWSVGSEEIQSTDFTELLSSLVALGYFYPVDL